MALIGLAIGLFLGWLVALYFHANGFSYPGMEELAERFNLPGEMYPSITLLGHDAWVRSWSSCSVCWLRFTRRCVCCGCVRLKP